MKTDSEQNEDISSNTYRKNLLGQKSQPMVPLSIFKPKQDLLSRVQLDFKLQESYSTSSVAELHTAAGHTQPSVKPLVQVL